MPIRTRYGMTHLRTLAQDGLKAVHILPSFHFASVNEDKSTWMIPGELVAYPADGTQQQAAVTATQTNPAYNWGYDPVHYLAPEGAMRSIRTTGCENIGRWWRACIRRG